MFWCGLLSGTALLAGDLSQYRAFHLGMSVQAVAAQAGMDASEATVLYSKPALLEQMEWNPNLGSGAPGRPDPVHSGAFDFCNGSLYRILIIYDDIKTEGLTAEDLTQALTPAFGTATHPVARVTLTAEGILENATVMAQWEDADHLVRLLRLSYRDRIALLLTAKGLDSLAARATADAQKLEEQQAPERDAARQKQQVADEQAALAKARVVNKPNFRP